MVLQQMLERGNESLLSDLMAFERKFPKKAPWHCWPGPF
jgi:hypothetical protein